MLDTLNKKLNEVNGELNRLGREKEIATAEAIEVAKKEAVKRVNDEFNTIAMKLNAKAEVLRELIDTPTETE